jgi:hypothetical protein
MNELVRRLSASAHPVEVTLRPERTAAALRRRIEEFGFVHIKFTDTQGGTELIVKLDKEACDLASADFEGASGKVALSGRLILDYVPVRCDAEIDLGTLAGTGQLHVLEEGAGEPGAAAANAPAAAPPS